MNEIFRRRLIGLAVLLVLVFILSLLLPRGASRPRDGDVPTTTVALGVLPTPVEPSRPSPDAAPALQLAPALKPAETKPVEPKGPATQSMPSIKGPASTASSVVPKVTPQPSSTREKPSGASVTPSPPTVPKPHLVETPTLSKPAPVTPAASTAVTAKPAAPESKPAAGTLWYVQIGSFAEAGNAQTTLSLLQNIGYRGESAKITSAGKSLFRVRLGPFPTETVAKQALDKVARQGYPQARMTSETRP